MLSTGTQRRALSRHQSEEMKIVNISFPRVRIESTTCRIYSHTLVPLLNDWPQLNYNLSNKLYYLVTLGRFII